jgi:hypothetical protein
MMNSVFRNAIPYGSSRSRRFGGTYRLASLRSVLRLLPILVTLMTEAILSPKRLFLYESHGLTFPKMRFFQIIHSLRHEDEGDTNVQLSIDYLRSQFSRNATSHQL